MRGARYVHGDSFRGKSLQHEIPFYQTPCYLQLEAALTLITEF